MSLHSDRALQFLPYTPPALHVVARENGETGRVTSVKEVSPDNGLELLHSPNHHVWFDLCAPGENEFQWLETSFNFHPLTIEDCREQARPQISEYPGYLFLTLQTPATETTKEYKSARLHIFLGDKFFVTVHDIPIRAIDNLKVLQRRNMQLSEWGTSALLYRLSDLAVDAFFPVLEDMDDRVEDLEDRIVHDTTGGGSSVLLNEIFELKRDLVMIRKTVHPLREVFNAVMVHRYPHIDQRALVYLRDVYDHLVGFRDALDSYRDLVSNALDTYLSTVSNTLNQVMKRLTIITTIFMPLTFVTGFFGMNFSTIPWGSDAWFYTALAGMVLAPIAMLAWFLSEGYIGRRPC